MIRVTSYIKPIQLIPSFRYIGKSTNQYVVVVYTMESSSLGHVGLGLGQSLSQYLNLT